MSLEKSDAHVVNLADGPARNKLSLLCGFRIAYVNRMIYRSMRH